MPEFRALQGLDADVDFEIDDSVFAPPVLARMGLKGRILLQSRDADILFTLNGVSPVAQDPSTGTTMYFPATLVCEGTEMRDLRMTRATGKNAHLHVRYETRLS